MSIKLVMSDVDGTLLNSLGQVSLRNKEAIKKIKEKGILFGLVTGRPVESIEKNAKLWGIDEYIDVVAGVNGAYVKDYILNQEVFSHCLEGCYYQEIIQHFIDLDVNFAVIHDHVFKAMYDDRHIRLLSENDKIPYVVVDFNELLKEPQTKLIIICDEEDMSKVIARSQTFSNEAYYCVQTGKYYFEYMSPHVSKSEGLKLVCQLHHYDLDDALVFGDADNDQQMVKDAGIGVAMGNGSHNTKKNADYVTETNDHDGIAVFLEKYVL